MDYSHFFSDDVPSFMRSPVREIFRKVDLASIYSFAGGYPDASTFPLGEMEALTKTVVEKYGARALQYGGTQGVPELREAISARYGVPVDHIQITTSSQQGIDVCARVFLNPGDVVLTTNPAYLGALQSFKAYRAEVRDLTSAMAGVWQTAPDGTPLPSVAPAPPNVSCVVSDHLSPSGPSRRVGIGVPEKRPFFGVACPGVDRPARGWLPAAEGKAAVRAGVPWGTWLGGNGRAA